MPIGVVEVFFTYGHDDYSSITCSLFMDSDNASVYMIILKVSSLEGGFLAFPRTRLMFIASESALAFNRLSCPEGSI